MKNIVRVFDKTYFEAPFFHTQKQTKTLIRDYYTLLLFMALCYVLLFGYAFLAKLLVAFATSYLLIWIYQFFDKRLLFNSLQWKTYVFLYLFMLPHYVNLPSIAIGVGILFIFANGVLSVNNRPILSPLLLSVLIVFLISYGNRAIIQDHYNIFPYLFPMIFEQYQNQWDKIFYAIIDTYHIIAQNKEMAYVYSENPHLVNELLQTHANKLQNQNFSFWIYLVNPKSLAVGDSSLVLLMFAFFVASIKKIIKPIYSFLFCFFYAVALIIVYTFFRNMFEGSLYFVLSHVTYIVFLAVFVITDYKFLPLNHRARVLSIFLVVITSLLLSMRNSATINFIIAGLSVNIANSLVEIISQPLPFPFKKRSWKRLFFRPKLDNSSSINYTLLATIVATFLFGAFLLFQYTPHGVLTQKENSYIKSIVQREFPDYLFLDDQKNPYIFEALNLQKQTNTIGISIAQEYRIELVLTMAVQDDIIHDIILSSVSGATVSEIHLLRLEKFKNKNLSEVPKLLQEENKDTLESNVLWSLISDQILYLQEKLSRYLNR